MQDDLRDDNEIDEREIATATPVDPGSIRASDEAIPDITDDDEESDEALEGLAFPRISRARPGSAPGIEHQDLAHLPTSTEGCFVTSIDYSPDRVRVEEITDLEDFILHHRPEWSQVRWINVDGLTDMSIIQAIAEKYEIHPLAVEDMLHIPQRPKVDTYGEGSGHTRARMVIITPMIEMKDGRLVSEQITIVLGHKTVITFQETRGDVWEPIRDRIKKTGSRLRSNDASFLAYSLIDAIVDHCFPILEEFGDHLEELEEEVFEHPSEAIVQEIHRLKRQLLLLRRQVWPMREMIHVLQRENHECLSEMTSVYLRDVYDHAVQIIDLLETYREVAAGLTETYMVATSNRMNEIMKVLTIMSTLFIPLTFLAGVWGMNFKGMPEIESEWTYPWFYPIGFWSVCIGIAGSLFYYFKKRGWL